MYSKKIKRMIKSLVAFCMIFMSHTQISFANDAYVYKYQGEIKRGESIGGQITALMKIDDLAAYCSDLLTSVNSNVYYRRTSIGESTYYTEEQGSFIRAIMLGSYPTISITELKERTGIDTLTEEEAIAGTQLAIWSLSNYMSTLPKTNNQNVNALYSYLRNLQAAGAYQTPPIIINVETTINDTQVIFDYSSSVNISQLLDPEVGEKITITSSNGQTLPYTEEGYRVIVDITGLTSASTITFDLSGLQKLAGDVYFYDPEGGRTASQSLVTYFEGVTKVSKNAAAEVKPPKFDVVLTANKIYNFNLAGGDFNFELYSKSNRNNLTLLETVTNNSSGIVTFSALKFDRSDDNKTYNYQIKEVIGSHPAIDYDAKVYDVSISIKYVDNKFTATVVYKLGNDVVDEATFTNEYSYKPTSASIEGVKVLKTLGFAAEAFSFDLFKKVNNAWQKTETVKNLADGTFTFASLEFKDPGTYEFKVKEVVPTGDLFGIVYDSNEYLVTIVVEDDGNGQLVATVNYPNRADKVTVTNEYKPNSANGEIILNKSLTSKTSDITLVDNMFKFNLVGSDGTTMQVGNVGSEIKFTDLTFSETGDYTFTITEVDEGKAGYTYDKSEIVVTFKVTDNGKGQLIATATYPSDVTFDNGYEVTKTSIPLGGTKTLTGRSIKDNEFSFVLTDEANKQVTATNTGSTFTFPSLNFEKAGTYTYTVHEVNGGLGGVTYDTAIYNVVVTVVDNGSKLVASAVYTVTKDNKTEAVNAISFKNEYKPASTIATLGASKTLSGKTLLDNMFTFILSDGTTELETVKNNGSNVTFKTLVYDKVGTHSYTITEQNDGLNGYTYDAVPITVTVEVKDDLNGKLYTVIEYKKGNTVTTEPMFVNSYDAKDAKLSLQAIKKLDGREIKDGEFSFTLYNGTIVAAANLIDTKTNTGNLVTFKELTFDKEGTYYYTIKEEKGTLGGVTYDVNTYTMSVVVVDVDGELIATPNYPENGIVFTNVYKPSNVKVAIGVNKELTGKNLEANEFNFTLEGAGGVNLSASNNADGTIVFDEIILTAVGEYTYTITEVNDGKTGYSYDTSSIVVKVIVTDNLEGKLVAEVQYPTDKTFNNSYKPLPTDITLVATKMLEGRELNVGEFSFEVKVGNTVVATGTNDKDGNVTFTKINYSETGSHTYTIQETKESLGGVTYDESIYTVFVDVEDVNGQLVATAIYPEGGVVFTNTYGTDSTEVIIRLNKVLTGKTLTNEQFVFELSGTDNTKLEAKNDASGNIVFAAIKYTKAGEYTYTIIERDGKQYGYSYDGQAITVVVEIIDNLDGTLSENVTYYKGEVATETPTFNNTYDADDTEITITGSKTLSGRALKNEEFIFVLKDTNGTEIESVTNNGSSFAFEAIPYDKEGTYYYTVSESNNGLGGVAYDERVYTVQVDVVDNDGKLNASQKILVDNVAKEDIVFENTYTPKSTFAQFSITKELTGKDLVAEQFTFQVYRIYDGVRGEFVSETTNDATGKVVFKEHKFELAGTYDFVIIEVNDKQKGITYDTMEIGVRVIITDEGEGYLTEEVQYTPDIEFNNTYQPLPTTADIEGTKTLEGRPIVDEEFKFVLTDEEGEEVKTTTNKDGVFKFADLPFDAVGDFTYYVSEVKQSLGGVTYDETRFMVVVSVTDEKGQLEAKVTYYTFEEKFEEFIKIDEIEFNNKYSPKPTEVNLQAFKTLYGKDLEAGMFTFRLEEFYPEYLIMPMNLKEDGFETQTNAADGFATFTTIEYDEPGTYYYSISEINDGKLGFTYDDRIYDVYVYVYDDLEGNLIAEVFYYLYDGESEEEYEVAEFENYYEALPTTAVIEAIKKLLGRELLDEEFAFTLWFDEVEVETAMNIGSTVTFEEIIFTHEGSYEFAITEVKGDKPGVAYDETQHIVKVEVVDEEGQLTAYVQNPLEGVVFTNTYTPSPVDVSINAKKIFVDYELFEDQFFFELLDENQKVLQTKGNDSLGNIIFDAYTFTEAGTFTYYMREVNGGFYGYTYDDRVIEVSVIVTDDANGMLVAAIEFDQDPTFINTYTSDRDERERPEVDLILYGQKTLTGMTLVDEMFNFVVKDEFGEIVQMATNTEDGMIVFGSIYLLEAGTYTFTVEEVNDEMEGITYDSRIYTVVVNVTEIEIDGELDFEAEVLYPDGDIVFENTFTAPPVEVDGDTPIPETPVLDTGSTSNLEGYVSLLLISLLGFLWIKTRRRRRSIR